MSLGAAGSLYARILQLRANGYASGRFASQRLSRPVVSVGNLTMGGTGKTPFVEFLARRFLLEGKRPAVLSRGYHRRSRKLVVVSAGEGPRVSAEIGGDEPVALARGTPGLIVVVAPRRAEAALAAERLGADVFLLDDGYQHLCVRRDVDLLLLDAREPFGGGRFPPGGRLREPLSALSRADAFVFTRAEQAVSGSALRTLARWNPRAAVFHARLRPAGLRDQNGSPVEAAQVTGGGLIAVCGIARPESFTAALSQLQLSPRKTLVFGDHHRYQERDLAEIRRTAEATGSQWLVTTEKDAVKLWGRLRLPTAALRLEVDVSEPDFFSFLAAKLAFRGSGAVPAGR